jgi:tRNA G18 (ribose-2'-O)-methylase SpoU
MDVTERQVTTTPIEDPRDPRVDDYRALASPGRGRRQDVFVVEGLNPVRLLLASRFRTRSLLLVPSALDVLRDELARVGSAVPVYTAGHALLRTITGFNFHGGHLAIGERAAEPPLAELLAPPGPRALVVMERLSNPDNVGGVLRNAAAFGAAAALLSPGCADPRYRRAIRVSMGSALVVPFARLAEWPQDLERLRAAGYTLVALSPRAGATDIADVAARRVAILVGHESDGLGDPALASADVIARIPMAPGVDSLNAAAASAVALHRLTLWR